MHVFENEWTYKTDIVKSRIRSVFGDYDAVVYARQCALRQVLPCEASEFLERNHLQGAIKARVNVGLCFGDELVAIMTFGKCRFDKRHEWEMFRFCSKLNTRVAGGAGKMLSYFEKNYKPASLVTYADRRWSDGGAYRKLGFRLDHVSKPNYWYFDDSSDMLYSRMNFQKHKLKKLLETYDESKTEA